MYFGVVSTQVFFMNHFFFFFSSFSLLLLHLSLTHSPAHCFFPHFVFACYWAASLFTFSSVSLQIQKYFIVRLFFIRFAVASIHFRFSSNENGRFQSVASINFVIHIINSRNFYNVVNNRMKYTSRFFVVFVVSVVSVFIRTCNVCVRFQFMRNSHRFKNLHGSLKT